MSHMKLSLLAEEDDSTGRRTPHSNQELPPFKTWGSQGEMYNEKVADSGEQKIHGGLASRLRDADPRESPNQRDHTRSFNDPELGDVSDASDDNFLGIGVRGETQESGKEENVTGKTVSNFFDDDDVADQQGRQYFKVLSDEDIGGFAEAGCASDLGVSPSFSFSAQDSNAKSTGAVGGQGLAAVSNSVPQCPKTEENSGGGLAPGTFERTLTRRTPKVQKKSLPAALCGLGVTHPLRILLVDDNPIILEAHKRQLQMLGYHCDVAGNGVEAVAMVAKNEYDVLLLDLHMPEMDGFETAAKLRETYPPEQRPTLIAVTASSSSEESMRCLLLGIPFYLAKPLAIGELATLLMKCEPVKRRASKEKEEPPPVKLKTLPRKGSW